MDHYSCLVIGGGAGGVSSMVSLIDYDIKDVLWVDEDFNVGALYHYKNVPANTLIRLLNIMFLNSKKFNKAKYLKPYDNLDINKTYLLSHVYESLKLVTEDLKEMCTWKKGFVHSVTKKSGQENYEVEINLLSNEKMKVTAKNIIVCAGGKEKTLGDKAPHFIYRNPSNIQIMNLLDTMDSVKSKEVYNDGDIVAVVGGSHSGILAIMNAILSGKKIEVHLFMRSLIKLALWIDNRFYIHTGTGLKGRVKDWCIENIMKNPLPNIHQHYIGGGDEELLYKEYLPKCNKIIYALGFEVNYGTKFFSNEEEVKPLEFVSETNRIHFENKEMEGIYGLGVGYYEEILDLSGDKELYISIGRMMSLLAPKIVKQML